MKKKLAVILVALMLVFTLAACGDDIKKPADSGSTAQTSETPSTGGKKELRMAITASETSAWYFGAEIFKKAIEEKTDYTVTLFANEQLGGGDQVRGVEMIYAGESDVDLHSTIIHSNIDERFAAISMPFLYGSLEEVDEKLINNQKAVDALFAIVREKGAEPLAIFENGFRQLTNSKRPVNGVADMLDLKVRVPGMSMYIDLFRALGASPGAMAFSEVYTALSQGTIDGQENPLDTIRSNKIQEVQKYLTMWNYSYDPILLTVSKDVWSGLTEDEKKIFQEAATSAAEQQRAETRKRDGEILKEFEEKLEVNTITEEARKEFRDKLADFTKTYEDKFGKELLTNLGYYD